MCTALAHVCYGPIADIDLFDHFVGAREKPKVATLFRAPLLSASWRFLVAGITWLGTPEIKVSERPSSGEPNLRVMRFRRFSALPNAPFDRLNFDLAA
jgi:hypothetical protein